MAFSYSITGATSIGRRRNENQDRFLVKEYSRSVNEHLCAVADGMGGVHGGATASKIALDTISEEIPNAKTVNEKTIASSVRIANGKIFSRGLNDPQLSGMGTTIVGIATLKRNCFVFHIGDSRAYLIRDGAISKLTNDHTLVNELIRAGTITESQAKTHPVSHMLSRSLGPTKEVICDVREISGELSVGSQILLCSDGLYGMVSDEKILEIVRGGETAQAKVDKLIDVANEAGGVDNITAVLIEVSAGTNAPRTKKTPTKVIVGLAAVTICLLGTVIFGVVFKDNKVSSDRSTAISNVAVEAASKESQLSDPALIRNKITPAVDRGDDVVVTPTSDASMQNTVVGFAATVTATDTAMVTVTATNTVANTLTSIATSTATNTPTNTPVNSATPLPTATASAIATKASTATPAPTATLPPNTATPTQTPTPTTTINTPTVKATATVTATFTPRSTPTFLPTATTAPSLTPTLARTPTRLPITVRTATPESIAPITFVPVIAAPLTASISQESSTPRPVAEPIPNGKKASVEEEQPVFFNLSSVTTDQERNAKIAKVLEARSQFKQDEPITRLRVLAGFIPEFANMLANIDTVTNHYVALQQKSTLLPADIELKSEMQKAAAERARQMDQLPTLVEVNLNRFEKQLRAMHFDSAAGISLTVPPPVQP